MNIIVMPLLRPFDDPPFDTIGEVVDFITQVAEVSPFLQLRLDSANASIGHAISSRTSHCASVRVVIPDVKAHN
jgi:hypothetical protein